MTPFLFLLFVDELAESGLYESLPVEEVHRIDQILDRYLLNRYKGKKADCFFSRLPFSAVNSVCDILWFFLSS
jgi:hypothetical protein